MASTPTNSSTRSGAPGSNLAALIIVGNGYHRQNDARRFLHRDQKPANIMLTEQGHVKVMDFGLAKRVEDLPLDHATCESGKPD